MTDVALSRWEPTISPLSGPLLVDIESVLDAVWPWRKHPSSRAAPSAAASREVRTIDCDFQRLDEDVKELDEQLRVHHMGAEGTVDFFANGVDHDVALRMPRIVVQTFKARLRAVETSTVVIGPSCEDWQAIEAVGHENER